jgi:hypothetical protein
MLYLLAYTAIGLMVARKEYNSEKDYLDAIEDMYPVSIVWLAIFVSSFLVAVTWPYSLYLMWRDS